MALYLVRQLTSSELLQRLKTIGVKHPELCKALGEHYGAFPEVRGVVPAPSLLTFLFWELVVCGGTPIRNLGA